MRSEIIVVLISLLLVSSGQKGTNEIEVQTKKDSIISNEQTNYSKETEKYYSDRLKNQQVVEILENAKSFAGVETLTDEQTYHIVATEAYISPSKEAEQTLKDQIEALNFRFHLNITPNCAVEHFELEIRQLDGDFFFQERSLEAVLLIPSKELEQVFTGYRPEFREYDDLFIFSNYEDKWSLQLENIDYQYEMLSDIGGRTRGLNITVFKEKNSFVRVHLGAGSHTIVDSIDELKTW